MPSGKQILLSILKELSQNNESTLNQESSDNVKAGFLLHGSSASYMWPLVEKLSWQKITEEDWQEDGDPNKTIKKGIGIEQGLLSDLFDVMWEENEIPDTVKERFPTISTEDFNAGMTAIKLLLTSLEWHSSLNEVENEGELETTARTTMMDNYKRKLKEYRIDPEDYS